MMDLEQPRQPKRKHNRSNHNDADENDNFFRSLHAFDTFEETLDESNYVKAPSDWWIVLTDVKGSTKAIEEGRQHDVNTVGAASIAVLLTAMDDEPFPYAFGGDGASALVSPSKAKAAEFELRNLRHYSRLTFGLELRIGMVPVRTLEEEYNSKVWVGKYKLRQGYELAVFRGDALIKGEELMKRQDMFIISPEDDIVDTNENSSDNSNPIIHQSTYKKSDVDLSKLFCFWKPIKTSRGKIMSLLISVTDESAEASDRTYREIIQNITSRMENGSLIDADPIHINTMEFESLNHLFSHGWKLSSNIAQYLSRCIAAIIMWILCGRYTKLYERMAKLKTYLEEFHSDSNYCQFDQTLAMVLDCTHQEATAIEELCQQYCDRNQIEYGIHYSTVSLLTCFVPDPKNGGHIAFIDGGNGGYAMAAKQLKAQRKKQQHLLQQQRQKVLALEEGISCDTDSDSGDSLDDYMV